MVSIIFTFMRERERRAGGREREREGEGERESERERREKERESERVREREFGEGEIKHMRVLWPEFSPKSANFRSPCSLMSKFCGLRSRCSTLLLWQ